MARPPWCNQRLFDDCAYPTCSCPKDDLARLLKRLTDLLPDDRDQRLKETCDRGTLANDPH